MSACPETKSFSREAVDEIVRDLQSTQKPYRLIHIFGVLQTALSLAKIHDGNIEKVMLAALLHDCAKHLSREEILKLKDAGHIELDDVTMEYPAIWHGPAGAYLARTRYGIDDQEVLNAIEHHTLGCANPSRTLQIIMCADYCEPTRRQPNAEELRTIIRKDLRKSLLVVLNRKIEELIQSDQKPHPQIYQTMKDLER